MAYIKDRHIEGQLEDYADYLKYPWKRRITKAELVAGLSMMVLAAVVIRSLVQ